MKENITRENIIRQGAMLVHANGYNNTGIADILKAAGVPKGSFYFYFKNKDEFGLALVDYYAEFIQAMAGNYLADDSLPPLKRLADFMDAYQTLFEKMRFRCGCPIGNLMQEMSDLSEDFRAKVGEVYSRMQDYIKRLLTEARDRGDLPPALDPAKTALFILNSWEGAIMNMKLAKSSEPLQVFKETIFERVLK